MSDRAPYSRVYWSIIDDPKFVEVYDDDRALACWLRLLLVADQAWPASASLSISIRRPAYNLLVRVGLVDPQPGGRYRIHGLDTERGARRQSATRARTGRDPVGTQMGPSWDPDDPDMQGRSLAKTRRDETSRDETHVRAISESDDPYQAYVDATRSLTYPDPQSNLGRWIDRLAERFGGPAVADAIRRAGASSTDPKGPMKEAESNLLRDAVAAERAERADEQRRVAEKRKPVVLRRADDDISDEEADRLARAYRGGAA